MLRCVVIALVAMVLVACGSGSAKSDRAKRGDARLLVVSGAGASDRQVAHSYDAEGDLLHTAIGPLHGSLAWSPDGRMLAVSDGTGVSVERADGSDRRSLVALPTSCASCGGGTVAWSADGRRLAVGGLGPGSTGFDLLDVRSGRIRHLRVQKRNTLYRPIAFSPDGRLLAYAVDSGDIGTANCCRSDFVVARADGTRPRLMHRFGDPIHDGPGDATWSPDSTRLAFTDDGRDRRDPGFAIVDVRTAALHALAHRQVYDQSPAWSPDGTHLAVAQYEADAFTVRADGNDFHSLGARGSSALWLRNGDLLLGKDQSSGVSILTIRPGHASPQPLVKLPRGEYLLSMREVR
jgi:Tol biopolymer transport system component